jgi:excisionase family DNA binding protein
MIDDEASGIAEAMRGSVPAPALPKSGRARESTPEAGTPTERAESLKAELFGSDLSVAEVAHILDVDRTTVLRYLRDNEIFGYQLGREWRIPEYEIRAYRDRLMEARRTEVRHASVGADIDKRLPLLNAHAVEDDALPWAKIWCPTCGGPVLSKLDFDEDTGHTWYEGECKSCRKDVTQSFRLRPRTRPSAFIRSKPETELDDSEIPF